MSVRRCAYMTVLVCACGRKQQVPMSKQAGNSEYAHHAKHNYEMFLTLDYPVYARRKNILYA